MKRVLVVLVGLLAALAFAATASADFSDHHGDGEGDHHGTSTTATFCHAGVVKTLGAHDSQIIPGTGLTYGQAVEHGGYWSYTLGEGVVLYSLDKPVAPPHHTVYHETFYTVTEGACTAPAAFVPEIANVFLCYSAFQSEPGVWPITEAAALIKAGYWSPYAVPNPVTGGTNIGGYHLVCNLATGQSAGTSTLGGAGEVYGASAGSDVKTVPGHYPVVGP